MAAPATTPPPTVRPKTDIPPPYGAADRGRHRPGGECVDQISGTAAGSVDGMPELKARLQADLNTAMKARDELTVATLRMALTAVTVEEVAGKQSRELSDDEVLAVLTREAKKRREAAEAFDDAGRAELAERERAEGGVLSTYLPTPLDDAALAELVRAAITETGATEARQMGAVMKLVQPQVAGRADGRRVSDEVRRQLGG
jgi:hypothetical protein